MSLPSNAISLFAELLRKRLALYGEEFLFQSQEALITFLFAYSIIKAEEQLINKVFIEYPITTAYGSRDKIDLYIDSSNGCYVEVKYIRPIPSGMTRPFPQHRGKIIADIAKLLSLVSEKAIKCILLVSDKSFINHLANKPGFPLYDKSWSGSIESLVVNETERKQIGNFEKVKALNLRMLNRRLIKVNSLIIVLWQIE